MEYRVYREELKRNGNTDSRALMAYTNEYEASAVAGMLNLVSSKEPANWGHVTYKVYPFQAEAL